MLMSTIIKFLLFIVAFSTLVVGDPGTVVIINNATVTNNANEYWEPWSVEIMQSKKNTLVNGTLHAKKQMPDSMQIKIVCEIKDQDPIVYVTSLCDAMNDGTIGRSFVNYGMPKDEFPKRCPIMAGDWSIVKWDPPSDLIPPGVPDGPLTGSLMILEDGKEPYVIIDFTGKISHPILIQGR